MRILSTSGWWLTLFFIIFFECPILACAQIQSQREAVILAINDVYRVEGAEGGQQGGLSRVRTLRRQLELQSPDLLLLHAGDFLFPSLLSEWTQGTHMIDMMNVLDGAPGVVDPRMFVVFGNHEFEKTTWEDANLLQARINESEFTWLSANIRFSQVRGRSVVASKNLQSSSIVESGGIRIGIFGLTIEEKSASEIAYVNEFIDSISVAEEQTMLLREQGAEVVIALTHLSLEQDRHILERLGHRGPDLIIGGHEHQRHHIEIDGRWILKADADAQTASVVRIHMVEEKPFISFGYRFLNPQELSPDPVMQQKVTRILAEHESWYCSKGNEEDGCLQRSVGQTLVPLNGQELEIRRYETNLGNWVADQMRAVVPHADIAFINAGALRLNQTIPSGPVSRRHLEELFVYDSELVEATLDPEALDAVLERSTEDWVGQGHWLQVSGLAFRYDPQSPEGQRVDSIRQFHNGQLQSLPKRPLTIMTNKFLIEGGDGYDMLKSLKWRSVEPSLKNRIGKILAAQEGPIQAKIDGRICNMDEIGRRPCIFKNISTD